MEKVKTTVRIAGKDYTMVGNDSAEHMHRVAVYVDRKMKELSAAAPIAGSMVAVLTAMNIADELIKSQDEITRLRSEMLALQQKLHSRVEEPQPSAVVPS